MADQLINYTALLPGSKILTEEITKHTKTNIFITEQFLPVSFKFKNKMIEVIEKI